MNIIPEGKTTGLPWCSQSKAEDNKEKERTDGEPECE
jgi:hypothetical protein